MKIKTADLTGPALDWAVAQCEKEELSQAPLSFQIKEYGCLQRPHLGSWKPSSSWAQGGPIIEQMMINVKSNLARMQEHPEYDWLSDCPEKGICVSFSGPTPLIAAMRCLVASRLGDEVEIPEELL